MRACCLAISNPGSHPFRAQMLGEESEGVRLCEVHNSVMLFSVGRPIREMPCLCDVKTKRDMDILISHLSNVGEEARPVH